MSAYLSGARGRWTCTFPSPPSVASAGHWETRDCLLLRTGPARLPSLPQLPVRWLGARREAGWGPGERLSGRCPSRCEGSDVPPDWLGQWVQMVWLWAEQRGTEAGSASWAPGTASTEVSAGSGRSWEGAEGEPVFGWRGSLLWWVTVQSRSGCKRAAAGRRCVAWGWVGSLSQPKLDLQKNTPNLVYHTICRFALVLLFWQAVCWFYI